LKLIVGLGNVGKEYVFTRHNVGFMVLDKIAERYSLRFKKSNIFKAYLVKSDLFKEKIMLVKPSTFMNNSGACVKKIVTHWKINVEEILIVYDDVDLPLGRIRFRIKGRSAGHKGMESVIQHLGSERIKRLKIGIGRPHNRKDITDYVLSSFSEEEKDTIEDVLERAVLCCGEWINKGRILCSNIAKKANIAS